MNDTYSITFGEQAVTHIGMKNVGKELTTGFSLKEATKILKENKIPFKKIKLHHALPSNVDKNNLKAYVIIIKNGANIIMNDKDAADKLYLEQKSQKMDKKVLMRGRIVNKLARWNTCYSEKSQEADIENGKGTIVAFNQVPFLNKLREKLPLFFGAKAENLQAEMNFYYDTEKCGIGFHGDTERKVVICARLGQELPMHFQWFKNFKPVGERIEFTLNHGDLYLMTEKAVGFDWKKSSIFTLRHAAGSKKYTTIKEKKK